jgi:hypothetical protein
MFRVAVLFFSLVLALWLLRHGISYAILLTITVISYRCDMTCVMSCGGVTWP